MTSLPRAAAAAAGGRAHPKGDGAHAGMDNAFAGTEAFTATLVARGVDRELAASCAQWGPSDPLRDFAEARVRAYVLALADTRELAPETVAARVWPESHLERTQCATFALGCTEEVAAAFAASTGEFKAAVDQLHAFLDAAPRTLTSTLWRAVGEMAPGVWHPMPPTTGPGAVRVMRMRATEARDAPAHAAIDAIRQLREGSPDARYYFHATTHTQAGWFLAGESCDTIASNGACDYNVGTPTLYTTPCLCDAQRWALRNKGHSPVILVFDFGPELERGNGYFAPADCGGEAMSVAPGEPGETFDPAVSQPICARSTLSSPSGWARWSRIVHGALATGTHRAWMAELRERVSLAPVSPEMRLEIVAWIDELVVARELAQRWRVDKRWVDGPQMARHHRKPEGARAAVFGPEYIRCTCRGRPRDAHRWTLAIRCVGDPTPMLARSLVGVLVYPPRDDGREVPYANAAAAAAAQHAAASAAAAAAEPHLRSSLEE